MRTPLSTVSLCALAAAAMAQDDSAPGADGALLEPIVLETAARDARPILETPTAASVRDRAEIDRRQPGDLQDLIGDMPGVSVGGGPRGVAQEPNIRGFQDEQIVLRFDGGRLNFNQAHRGRFFVDPDIVERVEIVRGGGSTLYGSGALGGVIAIETRDPRAMLRPGQSMGGRLRAGYASNGDVGTASATVYGATGAVDALGFLGWRPQGSDFEDGGGDAIRDSAIDVLNGLAKVGVNAGESHRFEVSGSWYADEGTTPPNANAAASATTVVDRDARVGTLRGAWDYAPAGSDWVDLSTVIYFNDYLIEEDRDFDGRADETTYRTLGAEVVNRSRLAAGLPVDLVYGAEVYRDWQEGRRNGAARPEFPDAAVDFYGVFAEATVHATDTIEITPGVRFDLFDLDPDGAFESRTESQLSPRLGVSWRPVESLQIYGNVARAFRAPSLTELYTDGVHFATGGFPLGPGGPTFTGVNSFVPNPDLEPERATQFEIGARFDRRGVVAPRDRLTVSVNAYYADVRDFIDQRVTFIDFSTFDPMSNTVGGTTATTNVDAKLWGAEAEIRYDAGDWFAGVAAMLPRGEGEDGDALGAIPQDRATVTLGYRPDAAWEVGARATFARKQDDVPDGTEPADGFTVVDLFASWSPGTGPLAGAEFRAGVENLFDADYRIYPNGLDEQGRTFKLSTAFTF